jgi:threonine dehydrogenase-like Zn-dependent dehydrogenase
MGRAGVIDEIGPGADGRLAIGDKVLAVASARSAHKGAYQQALIVPAASVVHAPKNLDFPAASTLLMNALTARLGLDAMALTRGQTLAVTGSAGALGGYVIQLAKADGLRVIADVSDTPSRVPSPTQRSSSAYATRPKGRAHGAGGEGVSGIGGRGGAPTPGEKRRSRPRCARLHDAVADHRRSGRSTPVHG